MCRSYRYARTLSPLNAKLNPIYQLLALLDAHRILHVSRIRFNENAILQMYPCMPNRNGYLL